MLAGEVEGSAVWLRRVVSQSQCKIPCMVKITVRPNASLRVEFAEGELQLIGEDGQPIDLTGKPAISLCRCGGSTNKPFCDGTHSRIGFQGAQKAVAEAQKLEPQQ